MLCYRRNLLSRFSNIISTSRSRSTSIDLYVTQPDLALTLLCRTPTVVSYITISRKMSSKKTDRSDTSSEKSDIKDVASSRYATRGSILSDHQREVNEAREYNLSLDLPSRRKLYKCKSKYTTLDTIDAWPQHLLEHVSGEKGTWWKSSKKKVAQEVKVDVREDLNNMISLFRGDITTLEIDAIVNAANETLLGGGGVDGAIHSAAGPRLRTECELLDGCSAGEAKITCGYKLPARYVIHTVGPRGERPEVLKSCYAQSLQLMKEYQLKSVAFPCISTGIFGYPNEKAAKVALTTIRDWLESEEYAKNVERIIFCLFLDVDVKIYNEQMRIFFPVKDHQVKEEDVTNQSSTDDEAEKGMSKAETRKSSQKESPKKKEVSS